MRTIEDVTVPRRRHMLPRRGADGRLTTCYVGALVELPARTAAAAFDASIVGAPGFIDGRGATAGCLRSRYGALASRLPPRRVAVEVTLERWDARRCEVGVRPRGEVLLDPARPRDRWYLAAAATLSGELASVMERWALESPIEVRSARPAPAAQRA